MDPTIATTISAGAQTVPPSNAGQMLDDIFKNPFVQYIVSPAVVFGIVLFCAYHLLNIGSLKAKFNRALDDIDTLEKDVKKLVSHMDIAKTHLVTKTGLDANLFAPGSPLKLLSAGLEILNASGFKKIYLENKKWFVDEIKNQNVKSLSEIDEASLKLVEKCYKEKKYGDYKELAFQNGISVDVLLKILAIYLRDELAKEILNK